MKLNLPTNTEQPSPKSKANYYECELMMSYGIFVRITEGKENRLVVPFTPREHGNVAGKSPA